MSRFTNHMIGSASALAMACHALSDHASQGSEVNAAPSDAGGQSAGPSPKTLAFMPSDFYTGMASCFQEAARVTNTARQTAGLKKIEAYSYIIAFMATRNHWGRKESGRLLNILKAEPLSMSEGSAKRVTRLAQAALQGVKTKDYTGEVFEREPVKGLDMAAKKGPEAVFTLLQEREFTSENALNKHFTGREKDPVVTTAAQHAAYVFGLDSTADEKAGLPSEKDRYQTAYQAEMDRLAAAAVTDALDHGDKPPVTEDAEPANTAAPKRGKRKGKGSEAGATP